MLDHLVVSSETLQPTQPKHLPYFLVVTSAIRTYTAEQCGIYVFWDVLQDDLHLWEQHIEFTKLMNEKSYVSRLYTKVLKIHSHNEDLWVRSARWESSKEGNMNPDLAREILLKAQRVNPESQLIFLEMFRMELDLAKIAVKRKQILGLVDKKVC
uniref:Uncharacterized protein n=1 Tax=Biomphalaria glabrata TaxID=6526 RepID=A0A2C9LRJ1_BIOGL